MPAAPRDADWTKPEQTDFTAFKQALWPLYRHAPHLSLIDEALVAVARHVESGGMEGIGRLAIFLPPRHGKSQTVARLFPAWFLGRNPDRRIILTGYGASLVEKHSRFVRNLMTSARYRELFPTSMLARDSKARSSWDLYGREGGMDSPGILGAATGKGAHVLIIDDPVKSRKEAESKIVRDSVWEAYRSDLYTRLEPGGAVILIMTRWHEDDLAGRLLREGDEGDDWSIINLPALAEIGDALGRDAGEALWPARYPEERLAKIRAALGEYAFAALYQQQPRPREGALFKYEWIEAARISQMPERLSRVVIGVDPSASEEGAETGIIVAGMAYVGRERHAYILEDGSLHGSPDRWGRRAVALLRQHKAQALIVETNQGGNMAIHVLQTIDPSVNIKPVHAAEGKAARAEPIAALYEQGRVHHVGEFPALEDQLVGWTGSGKSPDRLDATVWALTEVLLEKRGVLVG